MIAFHCTLVNKTVDIWQLMSDHLNLFFYYLFINGLKLSFKILILLVCNILNHLLTYTSRSLFSIEKRHIFFICISILLRWEYRLQLLAFFTTTTWDCFVHFGRYQPQQLCNNQRQHLRMPRLHGRPVPPMGVRRFQSY